MTTGNNIKRKTVSNVSLHFVPSLQSAVCILYLVCILYPVCSLQSAVCSLHLVLTGSTTHYLLLITTITHLVQRPGKTFYLLIHRSEFRCHLSSSALSLVHSSNMVSNIKHSPAMRAEPTKCWFVSKRKQASRA